MKLTTRQGVFHGSQILVHMIQKVVASTEEEVEFTEVGLLSSKVIQLILDNSPFKY